MSELETKEEQREGDNKLGPEGEHGLEEVNPGMAWVNF